MVVLPYLYLNLTKRKTKRKKMLNAFEMMFVAAVAVVGDYLKINSMAMSLLSLFDCFQH